MKIAIVGVGRAGVEFADGPSPGRPRRSDLPSRRGSRSVASVDLVLLCVPDDALESVSNDVPSGDYVVAHVAGSRGLGELAKHARRGFLHPLAVLSNTELGAERLLRRSLQRRRRRARRRPRPLARRFRVALARRAARALSRHRVGCGQPPRGAARPRRGARRTRPVSPSRTFCRWRSRRSLTCANVGASRALTGPASRADMATIDAHLEAIPESERSTYVAMANAAFELAEQRRLTAHA